MTFDFVEFLFLVHEVKSFTFNFSAAQQSHVDALMLTQSEKLEKLTKKHMKEIQSLDESHKAEITKLNEDHATHVVELENSKVQEQALIKSESQEEISRLQTKIKQLEVKMSTLLDNLVSGSDPQTTLIKELKKEVESLRSVVDMMNEKIKSLIGGNYSANFIRFHFFNFYIMDLTPTFVTYFVYWFVHVSYVSEE